MSDRGAFVKNRAIGFFQLSYDWPGGVSRCFDDADAFFDYDTGVGVVVWGDESGEEG